MKVSKRLLHHSAMTVIVLFLGACQASNTEERTHDHVVMLGEGVIRKMGSKVVKPKFPEHSLRNGVTGVAVAEIKIDERGRVASASILQSPDAEIARTVSEAVKRWQFTPSTYKGAAVKVAGKLTFYFQIENGHGLVLGPTEMTRRREITSETKR